MKFFYFLILLTTVSSQTFAQKKIYLNEKLIEATTEENAMFYLLSEEGIVKEGTYFHTIYYLSGNIYRSYSTSLPHYLYAPKGHYTSYYESGNKYMEGFYSENSTKKGIWKLYHDNGQLCLEYKIKPEGSVISPQETILLINGWNEWGRQTLIDGYGKVKYLWSDSILGAQYYEEGKVEEAKKVSTWKAKYLTGDKYFKEKFSNGVLNKGISWDGEFKKYVYSQLKESASFEGGIDKFLNHLQGRIQLPRIARLKGNRGTTYTQFVVSRDGTLTDIKVLRSVSPSIDQECIRVLSQAPKWNPAKYRGQPLEALEESMVLPITF
ncbi:energy transducer TonB [Flammeovirga sp. SJP92]|uniref:energy transducer TonB n=1 Tax=Flammeovirga sp. SJP92 TaxID=1775430 RepID=UPI000787F88F|nr:energy transducer TonB [Flammeovirga sp. SJP92]KXX68429.1 hypothetical protein AVL50_21920 [Flammeovirga sp. SJP92]